MLASSEPRRWRRIVALSALCVTVVIAATAVAVTNTVSTGTPPVFTGQTPADGATVTTATPSIAVRADDSVTLFTTSTHVRGAVDGIARPGVSAAWLLLGYDDEFYPIYDTTVLDISMSSQPLSDGLHTAEVRVRNNAGVETSHSWQFAVAVPPTVILSPANGTKVTTATPVLKAKVADNGPVPAAILKLDGVVVPSTFDTATSTYSHQVTTPLGTGTTHVFEAVVTDGAGLTATAASSFGVKFTSDTNFSAEAPAQGTTVTSANPTVTVTAANPSALRPPTRMTMRIDGASVPATYAWVGDTTVTASYKPASLTDGPHTAELEITDAENLTATRSWQFSVAAAPVIGSITPTDGATVETLTPTIVIPYTKNEAAEPVVALMVNGVARAVTATGTPIRWSAPEVFSQDTTVSVAVTLTDAGGNASFKSWAFSVQQYPSMSVPTNCLTCHSASTHMVANCSQCHQTVSGYDPHGPNPQAPYGVCLAQCHDLTDPNTHGPRVITNSAECTACHRNATYTWPQVPNHPTDLDKQHASSKTPFDACRQCHTARLMREHLRHTPEGGGTNDCYTCHSPAARQQVKDAITAKNTSCDACHAGHPHPQAAITGVVAGDGHLCTECHSTDIMAEHGKSTSSTNADPCAACHSPGGPREQIGGAWDRSCDTPACHGPSSAQPIHVNYCMGCHEKGNPDFAVAETDFSAPGADRTKCASCHGTGITTYGRYKIGRRWRTATHLGHDATAECKTCHFWDPRRTEFYTHSVTTSYGAFATTASVNPTPARAHSVHVTGSWAKDIEFAPAIYCANCHQPAACSSCHPTASMPTEHSAHGNTAASTFTVAPGASSFTAPRAAATETRSCTAAACHGASAGQVPACSSCHPERAATHW